MKVSLLSEVDCVDKYQIIGELEALKHRILNEFKGDTSGSLEVSITTKEGETTNE